MDEKDKETLLRMLEVMRQEAVRLLDEDAP